MIRIMQPPQIKTLLFLLRVFIFFSPSKLLANARQHALPVVIKIDTTLDSTKKITIRSIKITGNKKTKDYIIQREMQFKEGDTLSVGSLANSLKQARTQIYNTNLFSEVTVQKKDTGSGEVIIKVDLIEKWYLFPTPQFQIVGRNFNEWYKTYHADLNRTIYGFKFQHYNLSGRGDQLRIFLLSGYSRNISFSYSAPYSNPALTEGFSVNAGFTQNREIGYKTSYFNKVLEFKKEGFVRNNGYINGGFSIRKGFFKSHGFGIAYSYTKVNDSIISDRYNPLYFNENKSEKGIFDIGYTFRFTNTDNNNYPLKGKAYRISANKRGTSFTGGINMFVIDAGYAKFLAHKKNWFSAVQFAGKIKAPFDQAYINQGAIGYGDLSLRGLEYYVIDGVAAAVAKYTLKKKIISFKIPLPFHVKSVPYVPFSFYAKTYADAGFSYAKKELDTRLNNRLLYTGGFGIDILTLYDINIKLEYSYNQLGEKGLFLRTGGGF